MPKSRTAKTPSAAIPDAGVEAEIERVCALSIDGLRNLYRRTFRSAPPKALTKDLIARMITWRIQEQAYGGHDRDILKLLDEYARGKRAGAAPGRRLKAGTVLVREYQNERHTVTVTPDGFVWREQTYRSLSGIARTITGMNWNGPRFFGLRMSGQRAKAEPASEEKPPTRAAKRNEAAKAHIRAQAQNDSERALP